MILRILVAFLSFQDATIANVLDPFLIHPLSDPPDPPFLLSLTSLLGPNSTLPIRSRPKRIPHTPQPDPSQDGSPTSTLYVTEDGDDISKLHASGPWTEWSASSECSRPCGGGVAFQTRSCGSFEYEDESACTGPNTRFFSCNTHACTDVAVDFRAEQCSAFNNVPFEGRFYTWLPYTRAPNKCELNCMPQGERFYYRHKRKVIDGTPCGQDTVCVNGNCLPVGCDGVLGSRRRQDKCRVCGGDGTNCNTVQGIFDSNDLQVGYNDVLLIPVGATNILVRETQATNNYLAIRNTTGHYYLNGNWRIDFPREIPFAGTVFHYERKPHTFFAPETIRALGPISEAIYVVVLYQEQNPGITFEYSVPKGVVIETEEGTEYAWIYDDWGVCSRECGGGTQTRNVNCARRSASTMNWDYVEPHLCDSGVKPEHFRYCNYEIACPVRWHVSTWDDCTAPCGSNITGTQYRNVFCEQEIQGVSALVEDEKCARSLGPAPEKLRNCTSTKTECTKWFTGPWRGCSSLCGDGYETRVVRCVSKDELGRIVIHGDEKCDGGKPQEYQYCFLQPCEGVDWIAEGKWGECKVPSTPTCNSPESANKGAQSRQVHCSDPKGKVYDDKFCHAYRKPKTTQSCKLDFNPAEDPSCKFTWYATQWSDCEFQSCSDGVGKKRRRVFCGTVMDEDGGIKKLDESKCNETKKYHDEEECELSPEVVEKECGDEEARRRKGIWFSGPWSKCSKPCAGGRRKRTVLCLVGNRTTTDVKVCGEEDVLFTTEECNTFGCDEIPPTEAPDTDDVVDVEVDDDMTMVTADDTMATDYEMSVSSVTEAGVVIVGEEDEEEMETSTVTDEPCEPRDEDDEYYDDLADYEEERAVIEEEMARLRGTSPMVMRSSRSVTTTEMSVSDEDGVTIEYATEDVSEMGVTGDDIETAGTGATDATDESSAATLGGMTTGTPMAQSTMSGATEGHTTMAPTTMPPTTMPPTTEPPTTVGMTTMPPTTMAPTTMAATTMGAEMTTAGVTTMSPGVTMTTMQAHPTTPVDYYDSKWEGVPPVRLADNTTGSPSVSGATEDDLIEDDVDEEPATEVEYITELVTEPVVFTTFPPVTLPKCPPKKRRPKPPTNCHKSSFGCCPDNYTIAEGPFGGECKIPKTCKETEFGCCEDGVRPAGDKWGRRGCGVECAATLFGCCDDGKTASLGNNKEGCVKDCTQTKFGCCLDGKTAKKGPKGKNCASIKCSDTVFSCCPDKKTPALGINFLGCKEINLENCKANFFGCCIDGVTAALGENEEGCPDTPPCLRTKHGCCDDEVTEAHGPNKEGCCLSSTYGCCPDNINAAKGYDFAGCTCVSSPYGCCPDNVTPARGPGPDCGCKFTEHGCCPDGVSMATGANHEGCPCSTFQYGCCPDGVSVAKGNDMAGCGCAYSEFGCCPDNRTPKNGSGDCGCESSQFGCCPDGVSLAKGDDFEGCEDIPVKPGDVCGLDKERGSCRNFTVRWFFDMEYGGCSRFWWGGCEGNANRFGTQDECRSVCVEPEGRDACLLPRVSGPCEGYYPSWYYDPNFDRCEQFVYSGCLGNNNRFGSRQECEHTCLMPERVDDCDQPRTEGPCRGNYTRWYYDKTSEKCEKFVYGGCKGNSNNFLTEKECGQRCGKDVRMRDVCFQPRSEGPCNEKLPRWYYDSGETRCVPFYYSGCQGNSNRFSSLDECEKTCPAALLGESVGCLEPLALGDCASYTERYYFDRYEGRCKTFIYSGCGGNTNNFIGIDDCRSKCETVVPRPVATRDQQFSQSHCFAPPPDDPTSCSENNPPTVRWYYDSHDGVCYQFRYYCSNSSLNNFDTRDDCEDKCGSSQDFCGLPVVTGPCSGRFTQYYYDKETDSCNVFEYSGCSGNGNRFDTIVQCEQRCRRGGHPAPGGEGDDERRRVEDEERRRAEEEARRYDAERRRIEEERRRYDEEVARRRQQEAERGGSHHPQPPPDSDSFTQDNICALPVDQGPCRAAVKSWFFDQATGGCTDFLYGGCGGNANRFESQEMCERQCGQFRGQDVCNLTPDPGPCDQNSQKAQKWYFNGNDQACAVFVYSGCGGNGNRFSSREECESVCHSRSEYVSGNDTITGAAICRLPPETGPCVDGFKRWYYNHEEQTCIPFGFGGCAGNLNRFKSFDTCINFCQKALGLGGGSARQPSSRGGGSDDNSAAVYYSDDGQQEHHPHPPYSAPCDCSHAKCPYGLEPPRSHAACTCDCHDPCSNHVCPTTMRCSVDLQGASFSAVCRPQRKPGNCPTMHHSRHSHQDRICDTECSSDADCTADLKCCVHGCGSSCVVPVNLDTVQLTVVAKSRTVNVTEGSIVEMECTASGSPRPDLLWVKVDSNEKITGESGRFRIVEQTTHLQVTSKLQIVGPTREDEGEYTCIADPKTSQPPASELISVTISESSTPRAASVLEDPTLPTTQIVNLGQTANMRCFALGWPRPSVTWWRGERMLPFSSERYEQMRDYSLVVRLVTLRDLGAYTCQAYNGLGRAASWTISLMAYGPVPVASVEDREFLYYVIDAKPSNVSRPLITPPTTTTTTTTTTVAPPPPPYRGGYYDPVDPVLPPSYTVPLRTSIQTERSQFSVGSEVRITCNVEGYPPPTVHWYLNDALIDLSTRRIRYDPPTLTIQDAQTFDSGTYKCEAQSADSVSTASVSLQVEGPPLHANCTDNSFFANCKLIVKARYCTNKYYARFCCKSCTLAGQLPAYGPHLQETQHAYFRKPPTSSSSQQQNELFN